MYYPNEKYTHPGQGTQKGGVSAQPKRPSTAIGGQWWLGGQDRTQTKTRMTGGTGPWDALRGAVAKQQPTESPAPSYTVDPRNRSVQGPRDNSAYARLIAGRNYGDEDRVFMSSPYDDRGEDDWRNLYARRDSLNPGSAEWRRLVQGANSYNPSAQGQSWANYKGTNDTLPPTLNPDVSAMDILRGEAGANPSRNPLLPNGAPGGTQTNFTSLLDALMGQQGNQFWNNWRTG